MSILHSWRIYLLRSSALQCEIRTRMFFFTWNLPGVYLVKESQRYYPYGNLLSHTLGYVGIDNQGLAGIELMYDFYLNFPY